MSGFHKVIVNFERQSTFHGICHAASAPPKSLWRYMWYSAFFVCLCALSVQTYFIVRRYRSYEKTVDLDLKFEKAPFPAVTICNLNPYKASAIAKQSVTRDAMNAYMNAANRVTSSTGLPKRPKRDGEPEKQQKQLKTKVKTTTTTEEPSPASAVQQPSQRYHPVYAECVCQVNPISGLRQPGSCFAIHKGQISIDFGGASPLNFHPSKCLCNFDAWSKTLWPCFPSNTWKERMCSECVAGFGHCPMHFYEPDEGDDIVADTNDAQPFDTCHCHEEYNHCVAQNPSGHIAEIDPNLLLDNFNPNDGSNRARVSIQTTTTTQAPEIVQAMGFADPKVTNEISMSSQAQQNLLFAVGAMSEENRTLLSDTIDELILRCSFNQRDCDMENDFKLYRDPTYGNCYMFNWNRNQTVTAHRAGANYGLRILLYANVSEYLPTSESIGFRITVHDKWVVPFPDAFGYSAPNGFLTSFGVRMKKFTRLSPPHGQCLDGGENSPDYIYHGYNYSVEGCHRSCTQKAVVAECKCADPMYPVPAKSQPCRIDDPIARDCVKNITQLLSAQIATGNNIKDCLCHQPCQETAYVVTFSASKWPSGSARVMECNSRDDLCLERYRKNAAMVQVFYEELNYETMAESPSYSLVSAFADFGGLTGLWIGASVVSMLELVTLGYYLAKTKRKNSRAKREAAESFHRSSKPLIAVRPTISIRETNNDDGDAEEEDAKFFDNIMSSSTTSLEIEIYNLKNLHRSLQCVATSTDNAK